jgi:hypothetical protein
MKHRDESIADLGGTMFLSLMGSTLLAASEMPAAQEMIDRIHDGSISNSILALADPGLETQWDLYALIENSGGVLPQIIAELEDHESGPDRGEEFEEWPEGIDRPEGFEMLEAVEAEVADEEDFEQETYESSIQWEEMPLEEIRSGVFGLDVESADVVHAMLELECVDVASAQAWKERLMEMIQTSMKKLDFDLPDIDLQGKVVELTARVDLRATGVDIWMAESVAKAMIDEKQPTDAMERDADPEEVAPSSPAPGEGLEDLEPSVE